MVWGGCTRVSNGGELAVDRRCRPAVSRLRGQSQAVVSQRAQEPGWSAGVWLGWSQGVREQRRVQRVANDDDDGPAAAGEESLGNSRFRRAALPLATAHYLLEQADDSWRHARHCTRHLQPLTPPPAASQPPQRSAALPCTATAARGEQRPRGPARAPGGESGHEPCKRPAKGPAPPVPATQGGRAGHGTPSEAPGGGLGRRGRAPPSPPRSPRPLLRLQPARGGGRASDVRRAR